MCAKRGIGFVLAAVCTALAVAELPPGYLQIVQVTNEFAYHRWPRINNHGQIVFTRAVAQGDGPRFYPETAEIYLYDSRSGSLTRLTDNDIRDDFPCINDAGQIAWSRAIGSNGTLEIVVYSAGQLTRLTYDQFDDYSPWINNLGQVAWNKLIRGGCYDVNSKVCFYDGQTVQALTDGSGSDQGVQLNDLGDIVWTRYDFCPWPMWRADIMMYSEGVVSELTRDQYEPQNASINNHRVVAWATSDPPQWECYVQLWHDAVTTTLPLPEAANPQINDRGDVVMNRWHEELYAWQIWLYRDGQFWQLTTGQEWNCDPYINDLGDLAWEHGPGGTDVININFLGRAPAGDLNCDGLVNAFDIDAFVLALTDPAGYSAAYPRCDRTLADVNLDGSVNAFDIDTFVEILQP